MAVAVPPLLSWTVSVALYVPALAYAWFDCAVYRRLGAIAEVPRKCQRIEIASLDNEPSNAIGTAVTPL